MAPRPHKFERGDRVEIVESARDHDRSVGTVSNIRGSRYYVDYDDPIPFPPHNHIYRGSYLQKDLKKL